MKSTLRIVAILALLAAAWLVLSHFFGACLSLDALKSQHGQLVNYYRDNQAPAIALYMATYVVVTALSIPGAVVMTLAGGAIFGFATGLMAVSFASTIGATCAFLVARFLLRDFVQQRFGERLKRVNAGVEREGAFYLFTLRLIPVFPFFLINILMALTPMRTVTFFVVSQVGMLAGTAVYVNAGTQLARLDSLQGILSPALIFSFALIGVFPLVAKKVVELLVARKRLGRFPKPKRFDYDLAIIGAGSAGLVSAYVGRTLKARVALIERDKMGGDCLNTGCVPSKALLHAAKVRHIQRQGNKLGMPWQEQALDFERVMDHVRAAIARIEPHDSVERYQDELGAHCLHGHARIVDPYHVKVGDQTISTRSILIATGASPWVPDLPGLAQVPHYTSDTIWDMKALPQRLVVLGGGPIGCELAQAFARLGSAVTIVQRNAQLLPKEDRDVAQLMANVLQGEGVEVLVNHEAREVQSSGENSPALLAVDRETGQEFAIVCDAILVALGRKPRTEDFGLAELGIETAADGTIVTDKYLRTTIPNIYACGDVAGPYQFTHTASHQAGYACINALLRPLHKLRVDYRVIPWCTFTSPEVARVGLSEREAREKGVTHEVTRYDLADLDRAIADDCAQGFIKVLTPPGKDKILGVTIVGPRAGDIISEWILAMKHGLGMSEVLGIIHIYPTYAEANRFAAGNWKKAHAPVKLLQWVERFHRWRRGG